MGASRHISLGGGVCHQGITAAFPPFGAGASLCAIWAGACLRRRPCVPQGRVGPQYLPPRRDACPSGRRMGTICSFNYRPRDTCLPIPAPQERGTTELSDQLAGPARRQCLQWVASSVFSRRRRCAVFELFVLSIGASDDSGFCDGWCCDVIQNCIRKEWWGSQQSLHNA